MSDGDIELSDQSNRDVSRKPLISSTTENVHGDDNSNNIPDSETHKTSLWSRVHGRYTPDAWHLVVGSGALVGLGVLAINLIAVIVVYARYEVIDHAAVVYTGSCSTSGNIVLGLHIVINVLSTILLACSNYSMQCLSAPSRSEIDAAHARRRWLSVGVPNVRNLFSISKSKVFLWVLLALSSFPLHLLWNSAAFETTTANNYLAVSVTEDFLRGAAGGNPYGEIVDPLQRAAQESKLERLENADCIRAYGQQMQHNRRNVVLVSDLGLQDASSTAFAIFQDPFAMEGSTTFSWMCGSGVSQNEDGGVWSCDTPYLDHYAATSADQWRPDYSEATQYGNQVNATVQYCLSERIPEQCKVSLVPMILGIVIVCNMIKIAAFVATLWISQRKTPLVTTGDAIQSFIERPDPSTQGRCLVSKEDYETVFKRSKEWKQRVIGTGDEWTEGRIRWGKAIRWYYWCIFMFPVSLVIMLAGAFYGPDGLGNGTRETWPIIATFGLGKPQTNFNLSDTSSDLLVAIITANSPQMIVTYIYLLFNSLMTSMLAMAEWCTYAAGPARGLRVSSPQKASEQRSKYFLQVPLRYGLLVMLFLTVLHWLVSQMVFMARIDVYDVQGQLDPASSVTTVYFSPLAMVIAVPLGSTLVLLLIGFAIIAHYPANVPLAACCSASISAACQPADGDSFVEDLAQKRLTWGVVGFGRGDRGVGHATFSNLPVGQLMTGRLYA